MAQGPSLVRKKKNIRSVAHVLRTRPFFRCFFVFFFFFLFFCIFLFHFGFLFSEAQILILLVSIASRFPITSFLKRLFEPFLLFLILSFFFFFLFSFSFFFCLCLTIHTPYSYTAHCFQHNDIHVCTQPFPQLSRKVCCALDTNTRQTW